MFTSLPWGVRASRLGLAAFSKGCEEDEYEKQSASADYLLVEGRDGHDHSDKR